MPTASGPNTLGESNLVFAIDTHDTSNGITPLGCGGFNGSTQGIKNILTGTTYSFTNGMKLTGRSYFTSFAIDYPESSYGGDGASRQGITPGYDVRSGGKLYDASRALHLWVFNNDTNSWIDNGATTYFRGARLGGHCYDNYSGAETGYLYEIGLFISDYNTLKSVFPNCTFIVAGSHRADQYTAALRTILYDLGMPTGYIDSDYIPAPEWILVGEPGLGTGNAFGWVYQNYTTNAAQVAHINFGLPIKARGGIEFDGTNDGIIISDSQYNKSNGEPLTVEVVMKPGRNAGQYQDLVVNRSDGLYNWMLYQHATDGSIQMHGAYQNKSGYIPTIGEYIHVVATITSGQVSTLYVNGVVQQVVEGFIYQGSTPSLLCIGVFGTSRYEPYLGNIDVAKIYNKALTAQEVRQNYQQYKTRFNLS